MKRQQRGFTLIEIMVVVAIVSILAVLALPSSQRALKRAKASRFINDLRVLNGAFEQYRFENKAWPPEADPQEAPPKMIPYLGKFAFTSPTPIGGVWDWDRDAFDIKAGISVVGPTFSPVEMTEMIDARIDDGVLTTGGFRQTAGAVFTNVLEQ